jgi:hypothetical protein
VLLRIGASLQTADELQKISKSVERGMDRPNTQAAISFTRAAEQGHVLAQVTIGQDDVSQGHD